MPSRPVGVPDVAPSATVSEVSSALLPDLGVVTTTTADPGAAGTALAVTLRDRFPQAANFYIRVEDEAMLVTAGFGTGAGSFTVTRGQLGTTGVAHAIGSAVYLLAATQRVIPVKERLQTFRGRAATLRTPGRAGTTGQKIMTLHNATASPVIVDIEKVFVDLVQTVVKAVTVLPPVIRLHRITVLPTNGTALAKVAEDTGLASAAAITCLQDASADGTSSATALTATIPANSLITEEFAPRFVTAAGYEMFDRTVFFEGSDEQITLRALEGIAVFLDYVLATQNPVTDMWVAGVRWTEYRVP